MATPYNSGGKPSQALADRKKLFAGLNTFIGDMGGWTVSIPGAAEVRFECLPDSTIPAELRSLGYDVQRDSPPEGQRIIGSAIVQRLALTSSGAFEAMTAESTKAVASTVTYAGIATVERWWFRVP
jgi:hypothetical protein